MNAHVKPIADTSQQQRELVLAALRTVVKRLELVREEVTLAGVALTTGTIDPQTAICWCEEIAARVSPYRSQSHVYCERLGPPMTDNKMFGLLDEDDIAELRATSQRPALSVTDERKPRVVTERGQRIADVMTMGADMAGVAVGALVVCAAAIPDKIKLQVKRHNPGWLESARLWAALVGPVSAKKSPIMNAVARPLKGIDSEMARRYSEERARHDRLSKVEQLQTPVPKQRRLLLQDTTIEAAQDILKDSPDGMLCYQDELSGWFGSMDKYSGGRGANKDRAFWLETFNGGSYSVSRISRGSVFIENLSVSILGGIQPEPMRKLADESMDDGLLQRLLPVVLRGAVESSDEPLSDDVAEYSALINRLHSLESSATFRFDDGAQNLRQELERRHLELQSCSAINRKLAAHIGKYDGIFARLCVVWHCIENAGGALPPVIAEATARRAAGFLHSFFLPHALAFYAGILGLSNDHDRLASVAGYILAHKLDRITNRDVQRGDRTMRGLERREIEAIFDQLDALGWIDRVAAPRPTDPAHWNVNPAGHAKFAERAKGEKERRERDRVMIASLIGGVTPPNRQRT